MSPSSSTLRLRWPLIVLLASIALTALALPFSIPARAQTDIIPKEMQALFTDISDIDKLRVLNPLKLTADQLDKIIPIVKKAQTDYNAKLAEAAVPPIRKIASEIKETREKMLATHSGVPKDFDEKVKKLQAEFVKRRKAEDNATLKSLSDSIKAILTKEQVSTASSLARKLTEEDGKPTQKGSDDQFFNLYVLGTIVVYPRIVPLLEDMLKTAESAEITGHTAQSAGDDGKERAAVGRNQNGRHTRAVPRCSARGVCGDAGLAMGAPASARSTAKQESQRRCSKAIHAEHVMGTGPRLRLLTRCWQCVSECVIDGLGAARKHQRVLRASASCICVGFLSVLRRYSHATHPFRSDFEDW